MRAAAVLFLFVFSSCARTTGPAETGQIPPSDYDVSFIGTPFKAEKIVEGTRADAVEMPGTGGGTYSAVVLLTVDKVLKGNLPKVSSPAPSKMEQAKEAAGNKQLLKLLTMDFEDPDAVHEKEWLSIAVQDPSKTFGLRSWSSPAGKPHRIYLKKAGEDGRSYIMTGAAPVSP